MQKKYYLFIAIILGLILFAVHKNRNWIPFYNYYFTKYSYLDPKQSKRFIVATEGHMCGPYDPPLFLKNIISVTFPDKEIEYRNDIQPHLIIRDYFSIPRPQKRRIMPLPASNCKWIAPYITISNERNAIAPREYKRDAPPILSFVSRKPIRKNEVFLPFLVWSTKFTNIRKHGNHDREFLVYVNSNCVKEREKLFALIKAKNSSAEALGKCSNTAGGKRASGGWNNIIHLFSQYNFVFAMENEQWPGYITEKILNVLQAGSIPIYWGDSETVAEFFNPKAYIDVNKFKSLEEAAEYIINISKDPEKVRAMQQEPMFKDNKVHALFLSEKNSPYVLKYSDLLRKNYYDFLRHKKIID